MPPVYAPGVAQVKVAGTIGPNPWAVILHWYGGSSASWTQSQINALATGVNSAVAATWLPNFPSDVHYVNTQAVDLSDAGQRISSTPVGSLPGTISGNAPTLSASTMVSHHIGARFRGGHPRSYLPPGGPTSSLDGDTWQAGFVSGWTTNWTTFLSDVASSLSAVGLATASQCCPRYTYTYTADPVKHKFIKARTGFIGPFPTTGFTFSNQIRSQRRRLGK